MRSLETASLGHFNRSVERGVYRENRASGSVPLPFRGYIGTSLKGGYIGFVTHVCIYIYICTHLSLCIERAYTFIGFWA